MKKQNQELKTLKDFELIEYDEGGVWNFVGDLKAEAIKWAKSFDKARKYPEASGWIMNFFNITEEDLK